MRGVSFNLTHCGRHISLVLHTDSDTTVQFVYAAPASTFHGAPNQAQVVLLVICSSAVDNQYVVPLTPNLFLPFDRLGILAAH